MNIAALFDAHSGSQQSEWWLKSIIIFIDKINKYGGRMRVCTDLWEWSSGSGNSYTYYTETRYEWVAP